MKKSIVKVSNTAALHKAAMICSNQEMSKREIRNRLMKWGIDEKNIVHIVNKLVDEKYIDEERFALCFFRDKIRLNKWGKEKIIYGLRSSGLPENLIMSASDKIDAQEYYDMIEGEINKKLKLTRQTDIFNIKAGIFRFAQSRGYEIGIVSQIMNKLLNCEKF